MQVKKQQLEPHVEQTVSKLGKEYVKAVYCHPAYFYLYTKYIVRNAGLDKVQGGLNRISRRSIRNLRYEDDIILMAENEEELKSFLMKVKEESGKSWFKTQHSEN